MFFTYENYDQVEDEQAIQSTTTEAATAVEQITTELARATAEAISSVLSSAEPMTSTTMAPTIAAISPQQLEGSSTIPIYQASIQSTTPGSAAVSILESIIGTFTGTTEQQSPEMMFKGKSEDLTSIGDNNSSGHDDLSTADWIVLVAGGFYVLASVNRTVRQFYSFAVYRSDPRLIELGYAPRSVASRVWGWTAKALETVWPGLWFDSRYVRDGATTVAINDKWRQITLEGLKTFEEELEGQLRQKRSGGNEANGQPAGGSNPGSDDSGNPPSSPEK